MRPLFPLLAIVLFCSTANAQSNPIEKSFNKKYLFETQQGSNTLKIELALNEDNTFNFYDNTNINKVVDISGVYKIKGNKIHLMEYTTSYPVAKVWRMKKNGNVACSRNRFVFTRICSSNFN